MILTQGKMTDIHAVQLCLTNFLGYGNPNGRYWFIGTEEGGAEIWRDGIKTLTLEQSLNHRATFSLAMDFREVWENMYGIQLEKFKGPTVWRFIAGFLLLSEGVPPEDVPARAKDFVFKQKRLGRLDGNHFLCELFPLPKKSKNGIEPYSCLWPQGIKAYHAELLPKRITLIQKTIQASGNAKVLITYEQTVWEEMQRVKAFSFGARKLVTLNSGRTFEVASISISERDLVFVRIPFFGQGRISFRDLAEISQHLKVYGA